MHLRVSTRTADQIAMHRHGRETGMASSGLIVQMPRPGRTIGSQLRHGAGWQAWKVCREIGGLASARGHWHRKIHLLTWAGEAAKGTGLMALVVRGESHVLRLRNGPPDLYPVHLHGLAVTPIRSNLRKFPPLVADTMLLLKNELPGSRWWLTIRAIGRSTAMGLNTRKPVTRAIPA